MPDVSKDEYIRREREHDEKKRRDFLEKLEKEKEIGKDKRDEEQEEDIEPRAKPRGIRERFAARRERKLAEKFKKQKDTEARREKVKEQSQEEGFGRKFKAGERKEYEEYKQERLDVKAERRRKVREGLTKLAQTAQKIGEGAPGLTTGFGAGLDVGDFAPQRKPGERDVLAEMFTIKPMGGGQEQQQDQRKGKGSPAPAGPDPLLSMFALPKGPAPGERDPLMDVFALPKGNLDAGLGGGATAPTKKRKKNERDPLMDFFSLKF